MKRAWWVVVVAAVGCGSGTAEVKDDSAAVGGEGGDGEVVDDSGGAGDGGATDGGVDPYACSSGTEWTGGDRESPDMHPGVACIDCHSARGERPVTVGGTVYPQAHEPDDCNGSIGVTVELTDSRGEVFTMTTNRAGNFLLDARRGAPVWPAHAVLRSSAGTREMAGEVRSGDCNACHTVDGAEGAPGRIMAP